MTTQIEDIISILEDKFNEGLAINEQIHQLFVEKYTDELVDYTTQGSFEDVKEYILNNALVLCTVECLERYSLMDYNSYRIKLPTTNEALLSEIKEFVTNETPNTIFKTIPSNVFSNTIMIHYPKLRISNEYDDFIDITHLYVKIELASGGKLHSNKFTLGRSEFTVKQWIANYLHSHVCWFNTEPLNSNSFYKPCLGDGPIKSTCDYLQSSPYNELQWKLFIIELDKYIRTESIGGIPYRYLNNVNSVLDVNSHHCNPFYDDYNYSCNFTITEEYTPLFKKVIERVINEDTIRFTWSNGHFEPNMDIEQAVFRLSKVFIQVYNEMLSNNETIPTINNLINNGIIVPITYYNTRIYENTVTNHNILDYNIKRKNGSLLWKFKGKQVYLNIFSDDEEVVPNIYVLDKNYFYYIIGKLIKTINYYYGRENSTNSTNISSNERRICFL